MNDTPETDLFADEEQIGSKNISELYSLCRKLEKERNQLKDIIKRASVVFCEEGRDGEICARMFKILTDGKE